MSRSLRGLTHSWRCDDLTTELGGRSYVHQILAPTLHRLPYRLDPKVEKVLRDVGDDWLTFECRLRGAPEEALPASTRFLAGFLSG